ncbi:MAG: DUF3300 domain-containing protein [Rhizobiaceae bacterium]|nr:DUF3300 domain-containing protein [Rhizobiaceae bacterium]
MMAGGVGPTLAQETAPAAAAAPAEAPLSEDELEILVARIALYPDELVAVITAASLFPLQIVEAQRFLGEYAKDKTLKPKSTWDSSVISLLNYPEIVQMMSDDLDWTQALADALAYQQKDVLIAIQQLREEAVAEGVIKTDDKVKVETSGDNIVIQSASPEKIYVPQYAPEMFYDPGYPPVPIGYYPDPYPPYYYPTATFFAGAVTGAIWAAAVDWDDWDVWGGHWDGGNIDIDCNHCFNDRDFNGKIDFKDVDWTHIDRDKIKIDRDKIQNFDRDSIKRELKDRGDVERMRDRAAEVKRERPANLPSRTQQAKDIRKTTAEGLKNKDLAATRPNAQRPAVNRPEGQRPQVRPDGKRPEVRPDGKRPEVRPAGKPKPAAKIDNRPKKPSALGEVKRGKPQQISSDRGGRAMGGGARGDRGGGGHKQIKRPGGGGHGGGRHR